MANQNDSKILKLKEQIETKKSELKKAKKFSPITNCSLELDGQRYNLNVLDEQKTLVLMTRVNIYKMSFDNLKLDEEHLCISGYTLSDWLTDLRARYEHLSLKEQEANLKAMEAKLDKMLSDEKKVELELDSIADMLK